MRYRISKQRMYATGVLFGACILLLRTVGMLSQGALKILVWWVGALLLAEMLLDVSCLVTSGMWWIINDKQRAPLPLRLGAAATFLHAFRVLVFVLGRTGPWVDFDVRPEHRAVHSTRWSWPWVYFAATMYVIGILGVLVIWAYRVRTDKVT